MRWSTVERNQEKLGIAVELLRQVPIRGWSDHALEQASLVACSNKDRWKEHFPGRSQDAIWYISQLADLHMCSAFPTARYATLSAVMITRLEQNEDLKAFVFKILLVDFCHPIKALLRTQRTSRKMLECIGRDEAAMPFWLQSSITVLYTLVVLVWLMDGSTDNRLSKGLARVTASLVGSS